MITFTVHTCGDDGYFQRPEDMPKDMTKEQAELKAESLRIDGKQWARVRPVKPIFKGLTCSTCCFFTANYCDKWDEPMKATEKSCGEFL